MSFYHQPMARIRSATALSQGFRDEVVLVNELRAGCLVAGDEAFTDALCAGGVAERESAIEAAARELLEETGLALSRAELIHAGAYVSPGGTSEKIAIVFGVVDTTEAGGVHGNASEDEDVLTVVLPAQEFIDRARRGEINDLKTLLAGYWLAENRDRLRVGSQ